MIVVFVGDEDGFYAGEGKAEAAHAAFGFPAGEPGVDEHGFLVVPDIIAVTVAA